MPKKVLWLLLGVLAICAAGCGKKEEAAPQEPISSVSPNQKVLDLSEAGSLKGIVRFEGIVPESKPIPVRGNPECAAMHAGGSIPSEELLVTNGVLQNAFVYVKEGLEGYGFDTPAETVTVSNRKCVYVPHVAGAQVNQPVILLNEDPTLHNIHSYSKNAPAFNLGLPFQGVKQTKKFTKPEVMITLKCDVHPWMIGYLGILPHPYFGVTGEDGAFDLGNLPPGKYTVEAWHEKLGAQSQVIEIGPRETKEVEFKF